MRIRVDFQGGKDLFIKFNYNHIIASIIYNKINDLDLAAELHLKPGFKFFTFSQLIIHDRELVKHGFVSHDGSMHLFISSPNETLINNLIRGFSKHPDVKFQGQHLLVENVSLIPKPRLKSGMVFRTLSPVMARTIRNNKTWDLGPGDGEFYTAITNNLKKKYNEFWGEYGDLDFNVEFNLESMRKKRITIQKHEGATYNRCYMAELTMRGEEEAIKFAYDGGIGEKNSMGFGMVVPI